MAGRIKHMERSHRSHKNKGTEFRRFAIKADWTRGQKEQRKSFKDVVKGLFHRHQDK